jgi:hypothetical protein
MKLTPKHILLIETIADPLDARTNDEKAEACGVSRATLYRLIKDNEAIELINKRTTELVRAARPMAYRCLATNFQHGDRASARDFLQALGDIGSGGNVTNVSVSQTTGDAEGLQDAMARVAERRRRVLATEE